MRVPLSYPGLLARHTDKHPKEKHYAIVDNGFGLRVFVKSYTAYVKEEYRRGQDIYETSLASGTFQAPRPIALVETHNVIVWECLDGLTPIREYLARCLSLELNGVKISAKLLHDCGSLLAQIHRKWAATDNSGYSRYLPKIRFSPPRLTEHVLSTFQKSNYQWVHGDFGCANVFVQNNSEKPPSIAVVDSCLNRFVFDNDRPDIVSPAYVDVSHFISSLYNRHCFNRRFRKQIPMWTTEFLAGYDEVSGQQLDRATVFAFTAETLQLYQDYVDKKNERVTLRKWRDRQFRLLCSKRLYNTAVHHLPI